MKPITVASRPTQHAAVQWDGIPDLELAINLDGQYNPNFYPEKYPGDWILSYQPGKSAQRVLARKGDWFVKDENQVYRHITAEEFNKLYREV